MAALTLLAAVVAVAAALRSTWSPCGLSMLSTITPMTERARGHRYSTTVTWFVVGAVVGGGMTGAAAAGLALLLAPLGDDASLALAAAVAGSAALVDAGVFGFRPPFFRRQVDDAWLSRYRAWVYGAGFGWQIGTGFATYIMTTAVPATFLLAALTGSPGVALAIGLVFGLSRGLVVLLGARVATPSRLAAFHRRFDALEQPVWSAVIALLVVTSAVAALLAAGPVAGLVVAAGLGATTGGLARSRGRAPGTGLATTD